MSIRSGTIQRKSDLQVAGKGFLYFEVQPTADPLFKSIETLNVYVSPPNISKDDSRCLKLNIDQNGAECWLAGVKIQSLEKDALPFILEDNQFRSRHSFWICLNYPEKLVTLGYGEPTPWTVAARIPIEDEGLARNLRDLKDLHIYFNGSDIEITHKCISYSGQLGPSQGPVLVDEHRMLDHLNQSGVLHADLAPVEIQDLFTAIKDINLDIIRDGKVWKLLGHAIDLSLKNPNGFLYKAIDKKRGNSNKPRDRTYLRIQIQDGKGDAPGGRYVLEIWPPGHGSIPHKHADCFGVIKVLQGEVQVLNYSTLSENDGLMRVSRVDTVVQDQIVWLSPLQFQTHCVENLEPITSITLQCYSFPLDCSKHSETFQYLDESERQIKEFSPNSDIPWETFKTELFNEYNQNKFRVHDNILRLPQRIVEEMKQDEIKEIESIVEKTQFDLKPQDFPESKEYSAQIDARIIPGVEKIKVYIKLLNTGYRQWPKNCMVSCIYGQKSKTISTLQLPSNETHNHSLSLNINSVLGEQSLSIVVFRGNANGNYERLSKVQDLTFKI